MSMVTIVSLGLQVTFAFVQDMLPQAVPKGISSLFFKIVAGLTLVLTAFKISVLDALLSFGPWGIALPLTLFGFAAPCAGLWEASRRGEPVFARARFRAHALTNALGGAIAGVMVWAAATTAGFDDFNKSFGDEAAFNIALPLATTVAIAFARSEQERQAAGVVDLDGDEKDPSVERAVVGYSLRHIHQLLNTVFLASVVFVSGATMLYLFAQAISSAKQGSPLTLSVPVVVAVILVLGFFLACGLPNIRDSRTVWMTFVTGTPAAIAVALVWLGLFEKSAVRDVVITVTAGGAYVGYCVELVLAERAQGRSVQFHYFSSVIILLVLTMLLGAVYLA